MNIKFTYFCRSALVVAMFFFVLFSSSGNSYGGIKKITVEDKVSYSKVSILLDRKIEYKVTNDGNSKIYINFSTPLKPMKRAPSFNSRIINNIVQVEVSQKRTVLNISLYNHLSKFSDYFLKSPPRIIINIEDSNKSISTKDKEPRPEKVPKKIRKKIVKKSAVKKVAVKKRKTKKNSTESLSKMEGFEDLAMPSLSPFVEIFESGESLSIYQIKIPDKEKLPDYPEENQVMAKYELTDPFLKEVALLISEGSFEESIMQLKSVSPKKMESEEYGYLAADAHFQMGLNRRNLRDGVRAYRKLVVGFPESKNIVWAIFQVGNGSFLMEEYKAAAENYEMIIKKFKDSPYVTQAKIGLAKSYFERNKRKKAIQFYKEMIEANPSSPYLAKAIFSVAQSMTEMGRYKKAYRLFEIAASRWPDYPSRDPEYLMSMGESFYQMMNYTGAQKHLERLINLYPKHHKSDSAMARMGDAYLRRGMSKRAIKVFAETKLRYPGSDGAIIGMIRTGDILGSQGIAVEKVIPYFSEVYKQYIDNSLAQVAALKAAIFLSNRELYEESFNTFKYFLSVYPSSKLTKIALDEMLKVFDTLIKEKNSKGDCLGIVALSRANENVIAAIDNKGSTHKTIGYCLYNYGQYKESVRIFKMVGGGNTLPIARFMIGKSHYMDSNYDEAIEALKKYRRLHAGDRNIKEATILLARIYELQGENVKALSFYERFLTMEKNNSIRGDVFIIMGNLLIKLKKFKEASSVFSKAISLIPSKESEKLSSVYFRRGEAFFMNKQFRQGLTSYNSAIKHAKDNIFKEANFKVAICYEKLGEKSKSREILEKLKLESNDPLWGSISDESIQFMDLQDSYDRL